jgi:hypothetical protein
MKNTIENARAFVKNNQIAMCDTGVAFALVSYAKELLKEHFIEVTSIVAFLRNWRDAHQGCLKDSSYGSLGTIIHHIENL